MKRVGYHEMPIGVKVTEKNSHNCDIVQSSEILQHHFYIHRSNAITKAPRKKTLQIFYVEWDGKIIVYRNIKAKSVNDAQRRGKKIRTNPKNVNCGATLSVCAMKCVSNYGALEWSERREIYPIQPPFKSFKLLQNFQWRVKAFGCRSRTTIIVEKFSLAPFICENFSSRKSSFHSKCVTAPICVSENMLALLQSKWVCSASTLTPS